MEKRLAASAEAGDIDGLYALLRQDPYVLESVDSVPFIDTPLHTAASAGHTQFALEVMRLKPSFGRKLNPDGLGPLDLALRSGQPETARRLGNYEPQLICVQGRLGVTPVHYVAEKDDADLLAEFLLTCPASVEDLTIRGETVAHIAVKNRRIRAFRVLFGWLQRNDKVEILNWRDDEGDTVLHIAARTNQTKVIKLLVKNKKVERNRMNLRGSTALDIVLTEHTGEVNKVAKKSLLKAGASKSSSLDKGTLVDFLITKEAIVEKLIGFGVYMKMGLSGDMRNAILVVAVLISTATFQAVLQPPRRFIPKDNNCSTAAAPAAADASNTTFTSSEDSPWKVVMGKDFINNFLFWNSISFATSLGIIYLLLPFNGNIILLYVSIIFLMIDYVTSVMIITPYDSYAEYIIYLVYAIFGILIYIEKRWRMPRVNALRRLSGSKNLHARREMQKLASCSKYLKDAKKIRDSN